MLTPFPDYTITSNFSLDHKAVDLAGPHNQEIRCGDDGFVYFRYDFKPNLPLTGNNKGGNFVIIHSGNLWIYYGHLFKINVSEGFLVKRGQILGNQGSTGYCTGEHLHLEVHEGNSWEHGTPVNPISLFEEESMSDYEKWFKEVEAKAVEVSQTTGVVRPGDGLGTIIANLEHCAFLTGKVKDLERENAELKKSGWTEVAPRVKKALGY